LNRTAGRRWIVEWEIFIKKQDKVTAYKRLYTRWLHRGKKQESAVTICAFFGNRVQEKNLRARCPRSIIYHVDRLERGKMVLCSSPGCAPSSDSGIPAFFPLRELPVIYPKKGCDLHTSMAWRYILRIAFHHSRPVVSVTRHSSMTRIHRTSSSLLIVIASLQGGFSSLFIIS